MANEDVMALDERVAKLEKTMAKGFFDQGRRMDRLEDRMAALDSKFDVVSESVRSDVKAVLEAQNQRQRVIKFRGTFIEHGAQLVVGQEWSIRLKRIRSPQRLQRGLWLPFFWSQHPGFQRVVNQLPRVSAHDFNRVVVTRARDPSSSSGLQT